MGILSESDEEKGIAPIIEINNSINVPGEKIDQAAADVFESGTTTPCHGNI